MEKLISFPPIINRNSKVLILGSMPGGESLRKKEYYGFSRNAFWRIMFELLENDPTDNYEMKKDILLKNNIALWDVIYSCRRKGSLDSAIIDIRANDFLWLYKKYPSIKNVFFNGAKAYETYKKHVGFDTDRMFLKLPSTSPAYAIPYAKKLGEWEKIVTLY